ncbi:hemerythrin domain-containing protein [Nocardia terpenica]|uniref:Hemerythrin domain-containing protein n=1 Tax=Nocardia terpenica TaxID=455432 RepID=A0A6G9Z6R3_9NOCA|nr:hemerythrin domain-containing protein [Nocardia terpenica]QIS21134.1 hemerythrin domain-containing protein [Nocardia terpenica]
MRHEFIGQEPTVDLVAVLLDRHRRIHELLDRIQSGGRAIPRRFDDLVRLFAAHEYAEHRVAHPAARSAGIPDHVVDHLMAEENDLERALAALCALGADDPRFHLDFGEFAAAAGLHCAREEQEEFVWLGSLPAADRRELGQSLLTAESLAPTRPHPLARRSGLARWTMAPVAALWDRLTDTMRRDRSQPPW